MQGGGARSPRARRRRVGTPPSEHAVVLMLVLVLVLVLVMPTQGALGVYRLQVYTLLTSS